MFRYCNGAWIGLVASRCLLERRTGEPKPTSLWNDTGAASCVAFWEDLEMQSPLSLGKTGA